MSHWKKPVLTWMNRLGRIVPKGLQRRIADFPGVLRILDSVSANQFEELVTPEGDRLVVNPLFHSNLSSLDSLGNYEREVRRWIIELCRPGMTAYDIGANIGIFSFLFSSQVGRRGIVYAFEPEKNNHTCLEQSIRRNRKENLVLDRRAVSHGGGRAEFDRRGGAFSGRLVGENESYPRSQNIEMIETVSIDELVKKEGYRYPDIMKIDVEGNEILVLEGMREILEMQSPVIICELHRHLGDAADKVVDLLFRSHYLFLDEHSPDRLFLDRAVLEGPHGPNRIIAVKRSLAN